MSNKKKLVNAFNDAVDCGVYYMGATLLSGCVILASLITTGVATVHTPPSSEPVVQNARQHDDAILKLRKISEEIFTHQQRMNSMPGLITEADKKEQIFRRTLIDNELFTNPAISEAEAFHIKYQSPYNALSPDVPIPIVHRDECMVKTPGDAEKIIACAKQKVKDFSSQRDASIKNSMIGGGSVFAGTVGLGVITSLLRRRKQTKEAPPAVTVKIIYTPPPPPKPETKPTPPKPKQELNF